MAAEPEHLPQAPARLNLTRLGLRLGLYWGLVSLLLLGAAAGALFYPPLQWSLLGLLGLFGLALCLGSSWLCLCLGMLTLFTGILTAVPVGFTLKGPQLFALLGLVACLLAGLRQRRWPETPPWPGFVLCLLSFLPSLYLAERQDLSLSLPESSLRLLFNYLLLQAFALLLLLELKTRQRLLQALGLALVSLLASLLFGFGQQLLFYLGRYDPFAFVGRHSSIVDFYGPFLRLSPGTFANEYGQILQSAGILLVGYLFLLPTQRWRKSAGLLLFVVMLALVINFTRASWLVFAVGAFGLLSFAGLRLRALLGLGLLGGLALGVLFWLSQILLEASLLLSIGARFQELGDVGAHSAGQRLETWQLAWQAFLSSPWIGNGWGRFGQTHNVPLQLLAEVGVLGFVGFYSLMGWCGWRMWGAWRLSQDDLLKPLQLTLLMAFLGCLAFDLTNHGVYHFVLWFCLAMGLACARLIGQEGAADKLLGS